MVGTEELEQLWTLSDYFAEMAKVAEGLPVSESRYFVDTAEHAGRAAAYRIASDLLRGELRRIEGVDV